MIKGLKIFDCTLREVGYQTGWHFTDKFVRDAYKFAQGKGIDYLELGFFHQEAADPDRGIYRYCSTKKPGDRGCIQGLQECYEAVCHAGHPKAPLPSPSGK